MVDVKRGSSVNLVDLDGGPDALILDGDGDTTISAPTDDQIDIEVGGTDRATIYSTQLRWNLGNVQHENLTVTTNAVAGNETYTIAQMLGGLILRDPNGGARSDVTPTAALIVAGISGATNDDFFRCRIVNTANAGETVTLTTGTDVTLIPATVAMDQNQSLDLLVRLVDVSATEAVTIYASVTSAT